MNGAQFSSDGSRVLTWSGKLPDQGEAWLWDVTKPELIQTFKHDYAVNGAQFSSDESRVLTWSGEFHSNKGEARLWDVTKPESIQTFKHEDYVNGAQFSRDESRVLTWGGARAWNKGEARLWDVTKPEPIRTFKHEGRVIGAQFNHDESRVLTWNADMVQLWELTDPLAVAKLTPTERILELKVRSGTTLNKQLNLQTLRFQEWHELATSAEYQSLEKKLPARKAPTARPTQQADATSNQPAR